MSKRYNIIASVMLVNYKVKVKQYIEILEI
jgi:hypothetical protein